MLLLGPPGVGKSETIRRVAMKLAEQKGLDFVEYVNGASVDGDVFLFYDLRLTEVEPSDLTGIPVVEGDHVVFKPLKWAVEFSKHPGVLFLDELTNVSRDDVVAAAYKILHDKKAGDVKFHPDVWVVAAGNTPEHSSVARRLPAPLVNRLLLIEFPAPTLDEWARFMDENYVVWDRRVLAYLKMFPGDFIVVPNAETLENFPTPRSWTRVAVKLPGLEDDWAAVSALCKGYLGEEVGKKFLVILSMNVPDISEVLKNPERFGELTFEQRHLLCVALAGWLEADVGRRARKALPLIRLMLSQHRELFMFLKTVMRQSAAEKLFRFLLREARDDLMPLLRDVEEFLNVLSPPPGSLGFSGGRETEDTWPVFGCAD